MRLALLVSIPLALLTLSEVLSCAHREDMSLDMSEKSQLVPARNSRLLEHNFLRTVGRTQIERSCKVYAGKTNWKTSWSLISRRCQMRTQRAIFVDFQEQNIEPWMFRKETKWPCKQEVESFDEELCQMTAIPAAFICCKACDIVAEDAFSVASQHSIGLIDIKWSTFTRPQRRYVIWYVWKNPSLFPWEIPAFWNIL